MTIFNTVIGGGSGDEVDAYALGDAKNAVEGDKVVLKKNNIEENPIPYNYFAEVPENNIFTANETLTGFVKKNNGGSLTVSTVEDPNSPPPAVPDEAGLKTTINYGGDVSINPNLVIASGITKTGTDLSGFTSYNDYKVTTDSPFTSLSSVSFFDIVMCATHPADGGYYHWLAGLTDDANGYRGFDIRTESNDFLEANIYHEDGTSTYLKSGTTLPTNTKTFIKLSYNSSSGYTLSFSSDGASYTQVASTTATKPMDITPPILYLGWRPQKQQSTYYWNGTIHLEDCFINVNGTKIWSGVKVGFGSVQVGSGYFRNTLTSPSDKYVSYAGGTLAEDNIQGGKATTMNIILGRSADMGSWTSDTEGYLSAQDRAVLGLNKKLSTPVYLWHDLSHITPAVPETLEPEVVTGSDTLTFNITTVGTPTISGATVTDFSESSYVQSNVTVGGSSGTLEYYTAFTIRDISAIGNRDWNPIIDTIPYSTQKGMTLSIDKFDKVLKLATRSSSTTYVNAIGHSILEEGVKYFAKAVYNGSTWTTYLSTSGHDGYNLSMPEGEVACSFYPTQQTLTVGMATVFNNGYNAGSSVEVDLAETKVVVNGVVQWVGAERDSGTVSLPVSWKTLDGIVYGYPDGFPKMQASAITVKYSQLNVDVLGYPTISSLSGDVSGFTTSNFLRVPYKYWKEDLSTPGSGFDIDIALYVVAQGSPGQYVLGGSTTNAPITLGFTSAGNMEVDVYCTAETTKTFRMSYAGAIEPGNRYVFRIGYNTSTGYYVTRSTNNGTPETLVTNSTMTPPYKDSTSELWLGRAAYDLVATGLVVHLADCAIYLNGEKKWEGLDTTTGEPALYATKTGDNCGFAIATKAPKGVDSSAVIGTVELDANGAITSYTPK